MAYSFTTSGALPAQTSLGISNGTTSASRALNNAVSTPQQQTPSWTTPQPVSAPATGIASHTTTHPDGSTVKVTYAPDNGQKNVSSGNFTTPSGAQVNGTTGGLISGPTTSQTTPSIFSGLIGGLSQASQQAVPQSTNASNQLATATTSPEAEQYTADTANYGAGNIPIGQAAADIGNKYGGQINDIQKSMNLQEAANASSGAPVGLGRAGLIAQYGGQLLSGTSAAEAAALQGNAQQLTAQQQAANAANQAAGQANTGLGLKQSGLKSSADVAQNQQSLTQSGLNSAASLTQPSATYPFVFDPATGSFKNSGGGVVSPQDAASAVLSGKLSYDQAKSSLGYMGQTGESQLQSAILQANPNANINQLQAQGTATAQNTLTAGTAGVQANQSVFNKAYGDYTTLQNAVQNVDQFGQLLTQNMGGINPSDVKYANQSISQIRSQLSSAAQAQFDSTLAALTSKVSGLLSVGGNEIPTDISSAANKIIDGSLPIGSLTSVLSRIQQEGNILLQNQGAIVNSAYTGLQGGNQSNTNNSSQSPSGSITWDNLAD